MSRPDVGGEGTVSLRFVERIGVVDVVLADVECFEQIRRRVSPDAVRERLGAAGRVATIDRRVRRRATSLHLDRQREELGTRGQHRLDSCSRQTVPDDLEEAELPRRGVDLPSNRSAIGRSSPPGFEVDCRDLCHHGPFTRILRTPRRSCAFNCARCSSSNASSSATSRFMLANRSGSRRPSVMAVLHRASGLVLVFAVPEPAAVHQLEHIGEGSLDAVPAAPQADSTHARACRSTIRLPGGEPVPSPPWCAGHDRRPRVRQQWLERGCRRAR